MSRIIIVSNRLPLQIKIEEEKIEVSQSVGGLATGMKSVHRDSESLWFGWSGIESETIISPKLKKEIKNALQIENCVGIDLSNEEIEQFYHGFSNKTIWPLFHYFTEYTEFNGEHWNVYKSVNQKFADIILENLEKGDQLWIHDYQLLLLPKLIKEKRPDVSIGFFLHIPFPSFEVFRILPWRQEILEGMLGADLLGFHTYDYERHFFSSVRRILGKDISFNKITLDNRIVVADSFPMGIDYNRFRNAAIEHQQKSLVHKSKIQKDLYRYMLSNPDTKLVLSIDRLDYTKGIAKRLYAFEHFLNKYPKYLEKVTLVMLCVPSRANVEQYQIMKKEVDELVGRINGEYSTINWTPIWYFYRSLPFESLVDLYTSCDAALLTPIRDGMNLVAKEFIASKIDQKGVLILSEMAGASNELSEALVINPNNLDAVADAISEGLEMEDSEQVERIKTMQNRIKRWDVKKWANDFMTALDDTQNYQQQFMIKKLSPSVANRIIEHYKKSEKRIIFLDYDGTLVEFKKKPLDAFPDNQLLSTLKKITDNPKNELVIISGRDRDTMQKWFGNMNLTLIVEHGFWSKESGDEWKSIGTMDASWKEVIRPIMDSFVDRTPGTFIEEKSYSLVWHYRKADPEFSSLRAYELKDQLTSLCANHDLEILEGNKVIELKNSGVNKGTEAAKKLQNKHFEFILGAGDDWTDEYLFEGLPEESVTIKIGIKHTKAKYNINDVKTFREFISVLSEID